MRRAASSAVCALLLTAFAGCRTQPPAPAPPPPPPPENSAADWHALIVAPFGSALKEIPVALHEVLLFRDDAPGGAAPDDAECYSPDTAAPPLLGRTPQDYLLCFTHDRLSRIQASMPLTSEEAADVFANACAAWVRHAATAAPTGVAAGTAAAAAAAAASTTPASTTPGSAAPTAAASTGAASSGAASTGAASTGAAPASAPTTAAASADAASSGAASTGAALSGADCEGRDGAIRFVGHLAAEAEAAEGSGVTLSLTLDSPES